MSGAGEIDVWAGADGRWRWRYREPGIHNAFVGNRDHDSVGGAVEAAHTAYPGVRITVAPADGEPPTATRRKRRRRFRRSLLLLAVIVSGFTLLVATALVILAVGSRRLRARGEPRTRRRTRSG